jgi:5-methylcytosine-specific restriction endonuclease McrA
MSPIRPENRGLYGPDWQQIRGRILARAGWRCEGSPTYPDCRARNGRLHPVTDAAVVLTVAHLDHDPTNNDESNLAAWCQRCHNTYDVEHRRQTRARTRRRTLEAAGQGRLDVQ